MTGEDLLKYNMQLVFAIGAGQFDLALWMLCFVTVEFYLKVTASFINGDEEVEVDLGKVYVDCTMSRVINI